MSPHSQSAARELAELVHQFLGHQVETSNQLTGASKESLTVASECIEQAYEFPRRPTPSDRLLRIYESHVAAMAQATSHCIEAAAAAAAAEVAAVASSSSSSAAAATAGHHHPPPTQRANTLGDLDPQLLQQPAGAAKQHSQHPISQLPMTTRKKLSHLRAQIKRQASKAARSRLEKRSSVSGGAAGDTPVAGAGGKLHQSPAACGLQPGALLAGSADLYNGSGPSGLKQLDHPLYSSKDAPNTSTTNTNNNSHHHHNNSSSLDSPYSGSPTIVKQAMSSSLGGQQGSANLAAAAAGATGSDQTDCQIANSSLPSNQHHHHHHHHNQPEPSSSSSSGGHKLSHLIPGTHHQQQQQHSGMGVSVHQKNFKQKLIALIKKFRTDGSNFDSEEQYREALERELIKATAGRGSRAIEELFEEEIDVDAESGSGPDDWDNISESSTPKPSLRPFFSSTTLDKI